MATEDNLPAEQDGALPAVRADDLPDVQAFAAEGVTDVLPPIAYQGIGSLANTLTQEQEDILDEPTPDDEVDIRPDGLVFASHEYYRRKLNKVFGRFGWTLIPGSPLKPRTDKTTTDRSEWFQRWILFINGIYVSEAIASRTLYEDNKQMSLDDVAEAIKSDALKRACKDLGICGELWQKRWTERWRRTYAKKVPVRVWRRGSQVTEERWRRIDQDPLEGEISISPKSSTGSDSTTSRGGQSGSPPTDPAANAEAGSGSRSTMSTQGPRQSKPPPSGAGQGQSETQNSPNASRSAESATEQRPPASSAESSTEREQNTSGTSAGASSARQPSGSGQSSTTGRSASSATGAGTSRGRGTPINQGQTNLVLKRARLAGVLTGDDPTQLLEVLGQAGLPLIEAPGKSAIDNAIATIRQIVMPELNKILAAIDAAKSTEGNERI